MESIAPVLTKLAFEIACFQILEDLLDILKAQENSDDVAMLSLIDLDFEDQSIEIYLLKTKFLWHRGTAQWDCWYQCTRWVTFHYVITYLLLI